MPTSICSFIASKSVVKTFAGTHRKAIGVKPNVARIPVYRCSVCKNKGHNKRTHIGADGNPFD